MKMRTIQISKESSDLIKAGEIEAIKLISDDNITLGIFYVTLVKKPKVKTVGFHTPVKSYTPAISHSTWAQ